EDEVQELWVRVTQAVIEDVGPTLGAHLGLAVPRGIAAGTLYLAVPLPFTLKLLETRLRPAIMSAFSQIPEAEGIQSFIVLVDEDAHPDLGMTLDEEDAPEAPATQGVPAHQSPAATGASGPNTHHESIRPLDEPR